MSPWDETLPENDDQVKGIGEVMRSHKTEFRAALRKHFYWADATSEGTEGQARVTTDSAASGSARAFFAAQSAASAFRDGSLFVTSDTSHLIGLTSTSSVLLGGTRAIQWQSNSGESTSIGTHGTRMLVQTGVESALNDGTHNISFTTIYDGEPSVTIGRGDAPAANMASNDGNHGISNVTTGGFTIGLNAPVTSCEIFWMSIGTVSLVS